MERSDEGIHGIAERGRSGNKMWRVGDFAFIRPHSYLYLLLTTLALTTLIVIRHTDDSLSLYQDQIG